MSQPPSDKPPDAPTKETGGPSVLEPDRVKPEFFPFGLSAQQFFKVKRAMFAVARSVCRHSDASAEDAVQQAFVKALSKPISERQSIQDETKFINWICELTKWEAMTNRQSSRRRAVREIVSDADITEMIVVPPLVGSVEARKMLEPAIMALKPEERAFLQALYADGKTIADLAGEKGLSWSAMYARHKRILGLLYAAIQAAVAALMLLAPKKARAFVVNVMQQAPHVLGHATHFSGAMTVTVVFGVLLPTGSSAMAESSVLTGLPPYDAPQTTMGQAAGLQPSSLSEVEPEEPKALDAETNQCSPADMTSTKIASFLQETVVSLAFVVTPATVQVACTGTAQQTPAAQQAEEVEADKWRLDQAYESSCLFARRRGEKCPSRAEWEKERGIRPR